MARETSPLSREHRVWCTYALAALMVYVYGCERHALAWGIMGQLFDDYAFHWTEFLSQPWDHAPQLVTYIFLHANASHLIGNLVFFLFFARAVERVIGGVVFAFLFLLSGAVAALANGYFEPFVPHLIGASGAISGVMGAYFVLFPLKTPSSAAGKYMGRRLRNIPAFVWIGLWFWIQIQSGFRMLIPDPTIGDVESVAYWAHAGGFVFGGLAMLPVILKRGNSL